MVGASHVTSFNQWECYSKKINDIGSRIRITAIPCWNRALKLDFLSHLTSFTQSECFISSKCSYSMLTVVRIITILCWNRALKSFEHITSFSQSECFVSALYSYSLLTFVCNIGSRILIISILCWNLCQKEVCWTHPEGPICDLKRLHLSSVAAKVAFV